MRSSTRAYASRHDLTSRASIPVTVPNCSYAPEGIPLCRAHWQPLHQRQGERCCKAADSETNQRSQKDQQTFSFETVKARVTYRSDEPANRVSCSNPSTCSQTNRNGPHGTASCGSASTGGGSSPSEIPHPSSASSTTSSLSCRSFHCGHCGIPSIAVT